MHELSIAMSILEIAEEESERRGNVRINAIHVKVGPLAGVVKDALLSAYELAIEETRFKHCQLIIEEVPIVVFCSVCNGERRVESLQSICCKECGTPTPEILHGRELQICAMELAE